MSCGGGGRAASRPLACEKGHSNRLRRVSVVLKGKRRLPGYRSVIGVEKGTLDTGVTIGGGTLPAAG